MLAKPWSWPFNARHALGELIARAGGQCRFAGWQWYLFKELAKLHMFGGQHVRNGVGRKRRNTRALHLLVDLFLGMLECPLLDLLMHRLAIGGAGLAGGKLRVLRPIR